MGKAVVLEVVSVAVSVAESVEVSVEVSVLTVRWAGLEVWAQQHQLAARIIRPSRMNLAAATDY